MSELMSLTIECRLLSKPVCTSAHSVLQVIFFISDPVHADKTASLALSKCYKIRLSGPPESYCAQLRNGQHEIPYKTTICHFYTVVCLQIKQHAVT